MAQIDWATLPLAEKRKVVKVYDEFKEDGLKDWATALNTTPGTLGRQCRYFKFYEREFLGEGAIVEDDLLTFDEPPVEISAAPGKSRLTDIRQIDPNTDQAVWLAWLARTAQTQRHITVMHAADIHFPFHEPAAVELFISIAAYAQPDVIVVGSDAHDMQGLSSFGVDPDVDNGGFEDELDLVEYHWHWFISELRRRCIFRLPQRTVLSA